MRVRGYFSKPKGVRELRSLGKTALLFYCFPCLLRGTGVAAHPLSAPCFGGQFRILSKLSLVFIDLLPICTQITDATTHGWGGGWWWWWWWCTANFVVEVHPNINITVSCLRICARGTNRSRLTCYGGSLLH